MLQDVLTAYNLDKDYSIVPFGNGLINRTWKATDGSADYIVQQLNATVFKKPHAIADNIHKIGEHLRLHYPDYIFSLPLETKTGEKILYVREEGYYRVFPFVKGSYSVDVVSSSQQAFEAAKMFGRFTRLLCTFPAEELEITIPDFHNLSLRHEQFTAVRQNGEAGRRNKAALLIRFLESQKKIVTEYETIKASPHFKLRVTHHDTKISNVLFDEAGNGLCVIDLDTVMPGYFISPVCHNSFKGLIIFHQGFLLR